MIFFGLDFGLWVFVGLFGQLIFFGRFVVQWWASEKKGESVIPVAFWYLSIGGGVIITIYAIHQRDPVFILGQGIALMIYIRNLFLISKQKKIGGS